MDRNILVRRIRVTGSDATDQYSVLDRIVELQQEAFGFSEAQLVPAYGMEMTGWTFGMWKADQLIGFALCCLVEDEDGLGLSLTLQQLGVKREERRHGYGTVLMNEIIKQAKMPRLPIHSMKWCQDPMLARVGQFYICEHVPGQGRRIVRNRYGVLTGNYKGLPSHRLEVVLDLRNSDRHPPGFESFTTENAFEVVSLGLTEAPTTRWELVNSNLAGHDAFLVAIPWDFEAMKRDSPPVAAKWQEGVVGVMDALCKRGFNAVNFRRAQDQRFGEYLFIRP